MIRVSEVVLPGHPDKFCDQVRTTGRRIGYVASNTIDADRYEVHDTVCQSREDPRTWTDRVNDQSIAIGWAGYDQKVAWPPP